MNIIGQIPNKCNVIFGDDNFKSVNQESYKDTYVNEYKNGDLDIIPINIRSIRELMANTNRIRYFITNNAKAIMDILIKHELL